MLKKLKILLFNLFLLSILLFIVEVVLWQIYPDYRYYYRTHLGQPDLETVINKVDTNWLSPHPKLGWVCQQRKHLSFPSPPWESTTYQINQQGFRSTHDFDSPASQTNKKRILLIGDSFLFGIYLPESATVAAQLQSLKGEHYEFFTLAVPAWGLDQMYLAYQAYVERIQPDQVVLAFVDDDLMRSLEILFHGCGRKPCLKIEGEQLINNEDDPHWWEYLCWNNQIGNRILRIYYERKAAELAQFMLADMIKEEQAQKRSPVFVRIPALVDLVKHEPRTVFSMQALMAEKEVAYLQLYDSLITLPPKTLQSFYIPDDGHLTEAGAKLLAEYLAVYIF